MTIVNALVRDTTKRSYVSKSGELKQVTEVVLTDLDEVPFRGVVIWTLADDQTSPPRGARGTLNISELRVVPAGIAARAVFVPATK